MTVPSMTVLAAAGSITPNLGTALVGLAFVGLATFGVYHRIRLQAQLAHLDTVLRALTQGERGRRVQLAHGPLAGLGLAIDDFAEATEKRLDAAEAVRDEYEQLTTRDALTGVGNRQHFEQRIELEAARGRRYQIPESLILFELDRFAELSHARGTPAAKALLVDVTQRLGQRLRDADTMTLYGEGQLTVLATCTPLSTAHLLAEQLSAAVRETPFEGVGHITLSAGVAQLLPNERAKHWVTRTERLLDQAKRLGASRVCSYAEASPPGAPDFLVWGDHFATGIEQMDREHEELFRLARAIVELPADAPVGRCTGPVDALLLHLKQHFGNEEQLLLEQGCPTHALKHHAMLHQGLITQAMALRRRLVDGSTQLTVVGDFVVRSIAIGHLVNADLPLFSSLAPSAVLPVVPATRPSLRVKLQRAILG